jgi:HK97 family phage major capsid protein
MDADMTAVERGAQNARAELEARLARLEKTPQLESRAGNGRISSAESDPNSPEYAARWLRDGFNGLLSNRTTSTATASAAIPVDMERRIVEQMYLNTVMRTLCKVVTIDSKRTLTVETGIPTGYLVAEGVNGTLSDPTFRSISVVPYKMAAATQMTQEFIDDAIGQGNPGTGLDYIANRLAVGLGRIQDSYFVTGTGSSEPQGISDATSTGWATSNEIIAQGVALTAATAISGITATNLIDTMFAVPAQYRASPRFKWLLSDTALKNIRKLQTNSQYVWTLGTDQTNSLASGMPGTIIGVPYAISEYMPTAAAGASGANVRGAAYVIVGHWDYFEIYDRTGMQSLFDPYSLSRSLQSILYAYMRTDSHITNPAAFACISSAAS